MRRRYLCLLMCLYLAYICILNISGTADTVPQLFEKSGIDELVDREGTQPVLMQIGGRVIRREIRENGIRLLLTDITFPERGAAEGQPEAAHAGPDDTAFTDTSETASHINTSETASHTTLHTTLHTNTSETAAYTNISETVSHTNTSETEPDAAAFTEGFFGMLSERQRRSVSVLCTLADEDVRGEDICRGDQVILTGRFAMPRQASAPGEFDYRNYAMARNILFLLQDCRVTFARRNISAGRIADRTADLFAKTFRRILRPEDAAMLEVILLGRKEAMPAGLKKLYAEGGVLHICTVSGLHISLAGMAVWEIMRRRRHGFIFSGILSSVVVLFYCFLTGCGTGALRASVMFLFWIGSQMTGRTDDVPTALCAAGVLALRGRPYMLTDAGFTLSFGCLLSLYMLEPALRRGFRSLGRPWRRVLDRVNPSALTAGLAIWTGTLPLICVYYYQITPWSLLLNLLLLPCMSAFMTAGFLSALAGMIFLPAGIFAAGPCSLILSAIKRACLFEHTLPGSVIITGCPMRSQVIGYYAALAACVLLMQRGKRSIRRPGKRPGRAGSVLSGCSLAAALALVFVLPRYRGGDMQLIAADAGQGECIIAWDRSCCFMFDCGSTSVDGVWQYRIEPLLKYYGLSRISCVFLSHGDEDHTNGIEELLAGYAPGFGGVNTGGITLDGIAVSETGSVPDTHLRELCGQAAEKGIRIWKLRALSRLCFGSTKLTCLYPGDVLTDDLNANSMVILLERGAFRALFPGDLEKEGEMELCRILEEHRDQRADAVNVLLAGHHGSKNASSSGMLEMVKPDICIISCGKNNRYGHPAPETLRRLEMAGCEIYRTDLQRSILVRPAGKDEVKVSVYDPPRGYKNMDTGA